MGLDAVRSLVGGWVDEAALPGGVLGVWHRGEVLLHEAFGRVAGSVEAAPMAAETLFLVASVTKPVSALAVLLLVDRGELLLDDRVAQHVPEFAAHGKEEVRILHLLTHTSGLPDMVAANLHLRAQNSPLSVFVEHVCDCHLLFEPGTDVRYQSCGLTMLAEIVCRTTGMSNAGFLRQEIFEPLGMSDTSLGWREDQRGRVADIGITPEAAQTDWHHNSDYWRGFGGPWCGLITNVRDLGALMQMMLNGGEGNGRRIFSRAMVEKMTTNHIPAIVPNLTGRPPYTDAWGLGWWMKSPRYSGYFGDLVAPGTFGHGGSSGTVMWADPSRELICVFLTGQPVDEQGRHLALASNAVVSAVCVGI